MKKFTGNKTLQKKVLASVLALSMMGVANVAGATEAIYDAPNVTVNDVGIAALYVNGNEGTGSISIKEDTVTFNSKNAATNDPNMAYGTGTFAIVVNNGGKLDIDVKELNIGTNQNGGGDRGIRLIGDNNALTIHADKIVSYTGDEFVHVREGSNGSSVANIGTADRYIGSFEAHTGWGKDDYGVAILQVNEGNTLNFYADKAVFDGVTNDEGGVMGSGGWGTLNATVNDLTIDGNLCGSYGSLGGYQYEDKEFNLTVNTGKITMNGNINAGSMNTDHSKMSRTTNVVVNASDGSSMITGDVKAFKNGNIVVSGSGLTGTAKIVENGTIKLNFKDGNTWNMTGASMVTNATFGNGAKLVINGADFVESSGQYALTGTGTLKIEDGAQLVISGIDKNVYNVAKGFATYDNAENWSIVNDNALVQTEMTLNNDELQAVVSEKTADELAESGIVTASAATMLGEIVSDMATGSVAAESEAAASFIEAAASGMTQGNTTAAVAATLNSALQIAESGGASGNAITVVNNVAGVATQRLSFTQSAPSVRGGHGPEEAEDKDGSGIWAQYVHGKDKVDDMPLDGMTNSYRSQYNGVIMGYDFKKSGKFQSGIAFNYGEGDSYSVNSSIGTNSDFKFYGIGYYASVKNADSNIMFDLNYSKSDSDVTQHSVQTLTANPVAKTFSAGVKLEKLIENKGVQVVPYAGLRYMHVASDDYSAYSSKGKVFGYSVDDQNIWLIPVGVSIRQENVYESGWKVTPKFDLSYIWALGDTDSSMTVSIPGVAAVSNLGYTVMDNGSFLGTIGIEAAKKDWTFGLNYSYQKGEYARSDKFFAEVRYSF